MKKSNNIPFEQGESNIDDAKRIDRENDFDDQTFQEWIDGVKKENHRRRCWAKMHISRLTKFLFKDGGQSDNLVEEKREFGNNDTDNCDGSSDAEKMPINDFLEIKKSEDVNEFDFLDLIGYWYSWDEIMNSSINSDEKLMLEKRKAWIVNELILTNAFRFTDKETLNSEEIEKCFFEIVKLSFENEKCLYYDIVQSIPLKRAVTMDDINHLKEKEKSEYISIDLSKQVLPDFDWSQSKDVFKYLVFDDKTFSNTSKEHFPEGYNPNEVFEKGKSIGLWIDEVHESWYTWKWVSVAICDWQLKPHNDINVKEYVVEDSASKAPEYFHASAVSSILVWKQTGIAPDADLYFFAEMQNKKEKNWWNDLKSAFTKVFEKNKELPCKGKIRVVSISGPLYGWEETDEIVKQLNDSWTWVLDSGEFWKDFWYLEKKDPMWDPNDFDNYQHFVWKPDALFVNSWDRTVADSDTPNSYRHDSLACASWSIPVVAWYYALACQADQTMTPEKFKKLARDTAQTLKTTVSKYSKKHIWMPIEIKVIDIKALIRKIEEEKKEQ